MYITNLRHIIIIRISIKLYYILGISLSDSFKSIKNYVSTLNIKNHMKYNFIDKNTQSLIQFIIEKS